ncbi:MAG: 8-amino-7-oxononanoate synthase [Thermincolia bacterium]
MEPQGGFYHSLGLELAELRKLHLFREYRTIHGVPAEGVEIRGQRLLNLSGNNYLGIANHPLIKESAAKAIKDVGCGATASRLMAGNYELYDRVEQELARFKNTEAAMVLNSGYIANLGIITALVGKGDLVVSDKLNHASIIDGILLSGAKFVRYKHLDLAHLERILQKESGYRRKLIVTDSVFSMDGDLAPLPEIVRLKEKYGAVLMIDEAHGGGVFGRNGRGLAEFYGVSDRVDVNMGTLSKAFGCGGAYVAGRKILIDYLKNKARSLIYTTGLPPAILGSILGALQVVQSEGWRRNEVTAKAAWVRNELVQAGFNILNSASQIIPLITGDNETALEFSRRLYEANILAMAVRPPSVPPNSARLRLTIMATHRQEDLVRAVETIKQIGREMAVI